MPRKTRVDRAHQQYHQAVVGGILMKSVSFLAILVFTTGAAAQTVYIFSGLQWGMNAAAVVEKLKSSGIHPSPYTESVDPLCKQPAKSCMLEFDDGPIDRAVPLSKDANGFDRVTAAKKYKALATVVGTAWFYSGALVEVNIHGDRRYAGPREQQLRQKYGQPVSDEIEPSSFGEILGNPGRVLRWKYPSGDSIVFGAVTGWIDYKWGELNRILEMESAREKAAEDERVNRVRF